MVVESRLNTMKFNSLVQLSSILLLCCVVAMPVSASHSISACGSIPIDFPFYGADNIEVDEKVTINGNKIDEGEDDNSLAIDGVLTTEDLVLPALDPPVFPENTATNEFDESDSPFISTDEVFIKKITVDENKSITFSGGGVFHIDELILKENANVVFSAGTYFINKFIADELSRVDLASQPVVLHIGTEVEFGENSKINNSGNVDGLVVFLHKDASFEADELVKFEGLVYGPEADEVELGEKVQFEGAIIVNGEIEIDEKVKITLDEEDRIALGDLSTCEDDDTALGSFLITHDGFGINCLNESITVSVLDSNGVIDMEFEQSITLDTQTGNGRWVSTTGGGVLSTGTNGIATYTFVDADDGIASFSLEYQQGTASFDIDAFLSADSAIRDDDTEGNIQFSPSGFTVTASPLSNPPPASINDPVATQTAGDTSSVAIAAFGQTANDPTCGIIESYTGDKTLQFWTSYITTASNVQATVNGTVAGVDEANAVAQTVTFNQGQASVSMKYKDVGEINLSMKDDTVTDPELPDGIRGASNNFVSRPADIVITEVTRVDKTAPATAAVDQNSEVFVAAGEAFRVRVNVIDSEGDLTPSYSKEGEALRITASTLVAPAGGLNGSLNDGTILNATAFTQTDVDGATLAGGEFVGATFAWDEVGIIRLQASVADNDYLLTGPLTGTEFANNVGRFTPFAFDVDEISGGPLFTPGCNSYTYMDEGFGYDTAPQARVTAVNTNGIRTQNYDGVWWKLADFTETYSHAGADPLPTGITLDSSLAGHTPIDCSAGNCDGEFISTFSGMLSYARNGAPVAPFAGAVTISLSIVDSDGVSFATNPFQISDISFTGTPANDEQRYGRLNMVNVFGSELLDLAMPVRAEYYQDDNTGFVINADDSCSQFNTTHVLFTNRSGNLTADPSITGSPATLTMLGGMSVIPLAATGAGNDGSVDVSIDLGMAAAAMPWLQFDWAFDGNQDGNLDDNPQATATFGIFSGNDFHIYTRERY